MRSVLVPVDGSDPAAAALEFALEQYADATLTLLYVIDPMVDYSRERSYPGYASEDTRASEREKAERTLEAFAATVPDDRTCETALEVGNPARRIVAYADAEGVDAIVIGCHGREGVARYLLGNTAETVVRRAGVPVTVVRGTGDENASD